MQTFAGPDITGPGGVPDGVPETPTITPNWLGHDFTRLFRSGQLGRMVKTTVYSPPAPPVREVPVLHADQTAEVEIGHLEHARDRGPR